MQKVTKAQRVLEFIKVAPNGRTLKEIQRFILDMNGRQKWLDRGYLQYNDKTGELERTHAGRGYWCDYLYGNGHATYGNPGLLIRFCTKLPSGKWILTEKIEGPFRRMPKPTKSWIANRDRIRGERERWVNGLPRCKNCNQPMFPHFENSPDGKAHITTWAGVYNTDCKDRVWRARVMNDRKSIDQLTTISKQQIWMAADLARKITHNYDEQARILWEMLGHNLVLI